MCNLYLAYVAVSSGRRTSQATLGWDLARYKSLVLNQNIAQEEKDEGVSRGRSRNFKGGARGGEGGGGV